MCAVLEVTDDSGFLALIDPDAFDGFIREDWSLDEVLERFAREMRACRLLVWGTGRENVWRVEIGVGQSTKPGFREATGPLVVSRGAVLVTNYESLTMAAQFSDVRLPQAHEQPNVIRVPAGAYDVRVVQHVDPDGDDLETGPDFSVQLTTTAAPAAAWTEPRWFRRDG